MHLLTSTFFNFRRLKLISLKYLHSPKTRLQFHRKLDNIRYKLKYLNIDILFLIIHN